MSKVAELAYDIEQMYIEGYSPKSIAVALECPLLMVYEWLESNSLTEDKADAQGWDEIEADEYNPFDTYNS
jgi:hypothetical protein